MAAARQRGREREKEREREHILFHNLFFSIGYFFFQNAPVHFEWIQIRNMKMVQSQRGAYFLLLLFSCLRRVLVIYVCTSTLRCGFFIFYSDMLHLAFLYLFRFLFLSLSLSSARALSISP